MYPSSWRPSEARVRSRAAWGTLVLLCWTWRSRVLLVMRNHSVCRCLRQQARSLHMQARRTRSGSAACSKSTGRPSPGWGPRSLWAQALARQVSCCARCVSIARFCEAVVGPLRTSVQPWPEAVGGQRTAAPPMPVNSASGGAGLRLSQRASCPAHRRTLPREHRMAPPRKPWTPPRPAHGRWEARRVM